MEIELSGIILFHIVQYNRSLSLWMPTALTWMNGARSQGGILEGLTLRFSAFWCPLGGFPGPTQVETRRWVRGSHRKPSLKQKGQALYTIAINFT